MTSPATRDILRARQIDWRHYALFLDFDGTLAPIVERPADAAADPRAARALGHLTVKTGGALAVLSGRDLDDLLSRLPERRLAAAGSHGREMQDADGRRQQIGGTSAALAAAAAGLGEVARGHGLLVETKAGAVTIHYRTRPDLADACRAEVDALAAGSAALRAVHGHFVSEVVQAGVDKGRALLKFMERAPFLGRIPIAAGDDTTDEDAFAAAQSLGGVGIKIGPGETCAHERIGDIDAFLDWLHAMADR